MTGSRAAPSDGVSELEIGFVRVSTDAQDLPPNVALSQPWRRSRPSLRRSRADRHQPGTPGATPALGRLPRRRPDTCLCINGVRRMLVVPKLDRLATPTVDNPRAPAQAVDSSP